MDSDDSQAEIEILPEGPLLYFLAQVGVGGCNDPGVEGNTCIRAKRGDAPVGKSTQKSLLDLWGGVAYLIEHERAPLGCEEGSLACLARFSIGPLHVTKEAVHEKTLVESAAVDGHEGTIAVGRMHVNGAADQFLACAGFSHDEYVCLDPGCLKDVLAKITHLKAHAYDAVRRNGNLGGHIVRFLDLYAGRGEGIFHIPLVFKIPQLFEQAIDRFAHLLHLLRRAAVGQGFCKGRGGGFGYVATKGS